MLPSPWFGLWRGALAAMLPGLRFFWGHMRSPGWAVAAERRRRALLAAVLLFAGIAAALLALGAPPSPSWLWWLYAALGTLMLAWVGAGAATALMGAMVLLRGDRCALRLEPSEAPFAPIDRRARTAVVMPVCNEDIATVFAGLRATCESIAATGTLGLFDFYLLSDSTEPAVRAAELRAWERLRAFLGDNPIGAGARVFYRWRRLRRGRKAGNVADFCRRWGQHYRYMVVLDADSTMDGHALVSLVRLMEQNPNAGIVQTLPQPYGHTTLHARVQQFATRVTGRLFALGLAYWQLGDSHYWGHNAIIRVAPFMRHCALAPIRGRGSLAGHILSHDFVEAAMMRRAGHEVWLAPDIEGSWEQLPPHLLDELGRDRRWCRGNLQNAQLIAEPGWRPVHRAMFAIGALSYVMGPLWLLFIGLGVLVGPQPHSVGTVLEGAASSGWAAWSMPGLWLLTLGLLLLPRALGALCVLGRREQSLFGGTARLWGSVALEALVSALLAPVRMLAHSVFVLSAFTGLRLEWQSPQREAQGVAWRDALARLGWLCGPLLVVFGVLWALNPTPSAPQTALMVLPLLLAVPLAVWGGHPRLGRWLMRLGALRVPDEHTPPRPLRHAIERRGFADLVPVSAPLPVPVPNAAAGSRWLPGARPAALGSRGGAQGSERWVWARTAEWAGWAGKAGMARWAGGGLASQRAFAATASVAVLAVATLLPRSVDAPDVPHALRLHQDLVAMMNTWPRIDVPSVSILAQPTGPRVARERPARRIDDAVRARARLAVHRALYGGGSEAYEPEQDL